MIPRMFLGMPLLAFGIGLAALCGGSEYHPLVYIISCVIALIGSFVAFATKP